MDEVGPLIHVFRVLKLSQDALAPHSAITSNYRLPITMNYRFDCVRSLFALHQPISALCTSTSPNSVRECRTDECLPAMLFLVNRHLCSVLPCTRPA